MRNFAVDLPDALVFIGEAEAVHLLFQQEVGVSNFLDLHPAKHLSHDDFDVLVVDVYTLQAVNLLDFVYQVFLQAAHSQDAQDVVRIERAIH